MENNETMYKFFGEPFRRITSKTTNQFLFMFDTNGEFVTGDPEIIKRAIGHFDHIPYKAEPTGKKVKKTMTTPSINIETKEVTK